MKQMRAGWWIGLFGLVALIGCGGSQTGSFGGSSGSWTSGGGLRSNQAGGPRNQPGGAGQAGPTTEAPLAGGVAVYLTDTSDSQVDHAYVRVYEVSLYGAKASTPVFSSSEGLVVDLKGLTNSALFLGATATTPNDLVRVQMEVGKDFVIVPKGKSESEVRQFADSLAEGKNKAKLTLNLTKKGVPAIVLDFNLGAGTDDKQSKTLVALKEADYAAVSDTSRLALTSFTGKVVAVNGQPPTYNFGLNLGANRSLRVVTSESSPILDAKGDPIAKLTNGAQVEVRGVFDLQTKTFNAGAVTVLGKGAGDEVTGVLDPAAVEKGELLLAARTTTGSARAAHQLHIDASGETVYLQASGGKVSKEEFLKLATGAHVEVDGSFDKAGDRIKASRLKIDGPITVAKAPAATDGATAPAQNAGTKAEGQGDGKAEPDKPEDNILRGGAAAGEIIGEVVSVDKAAGTLTINPTKISGFSSDAQTLPIVINAKTLFRDLAGKASDKDKIFELLTAGAKVRVRGGLGDGGFIATLLMPMKKE